MHRSCLNVVHNLLYSTVQRTATCYVTCFIYSRAFSCEKYCLTDIPFSFSFHNFCFQVSYIKVYSIRLGWCWNLLVSYTYLNFDICISALCCFAMPFDIKFPVILSQLFISRMMKMFHEEFHYWGIARSRDHLVLLLILISWVSLFSEYMSFLNKLRIKDHTPTVTQLLCIKLLVVKKKRCIYVLFCISRLATYRRGSSVAIRMENCWAEIDNSNSEQGKLLYNFILVWWEFTGSFIKNIVFWLLRDYLVTNNSLLPKKSQHP